jgi:hypothetical protein
MSLASVNNRMAYTGNGAVDTYPYTFRIFDQSDLLVTVRSTSDVETTLVITTDYTVTGVGTSGGGNVVLVNSAQAWLDGDGDLLTGYVLSIRRVVDLTQLTDIRNQGDFYPEVHEDQFDKLTMTDQQQQDEIDRSMKLSETTDPADFNTELPSSIIGQPFVTIQTNAAGDGFEEGPTAAEIENAESYSILAKDWASKTDGLVAAIDNSSKAYAIGGTGVTDTAGKGAAKEWATKLGGTVDTVGYSAKYHADASSTSAASAAASLAAIQAAIPYRDVVYLVFADSPVTLVAADAGKIYHCDCTGGAILINLPSIALVTSTPKMFGFVKTDSSINKVTLDANGTDTLSGASTLLLESQNAGANIVADTDASPDDWTVLSFGASGGGGGAGLSLIWVDSSNAPLRTIFGYSNVLQYQAGLDQHGVASFRVPASYVVGSPMTVNIFYNTADTSGTVKIETVTNLIRTGIDTNPNFSPNTHTSTTAAVTLSGSTYLFRSVTLDITDGSGQVNGIAVQPGDFISLYLYRKTDTATSDINVWAECAEVLFT